MKQKYPHNKKSRKIIWLGAILALIFALYFLNTPLNTLGLKIINLFSGPIKNIKSKAEGIYDSTYVFFADKNELIQKNVFLENELLKIQARIEQDEIWRKEYLSLLEKFGRKNQNNLIMARVITNFSELPYDALLLDLGGQNNISKGMKITAFDGSVFIGTIRDVQPKISRGVLVSSPNEETNIIFDKTEVSAIAVGQGNGELSVTLPGDLNIEIGERAYTLNQNPLLVGFVEKIEKKTVDPLQKILIRLPLNISNLHTVFLLP